MPYRGVVARILSDEFAGWPGCRASATPLLWLALVGMDGQPGELGAGSLLPLGVRVWPCDNLGMACGSSGKIFVNRWTGYLQCFGDMRDTLALLM